MTTFVNAYPYARTLLVDPDTGTYALVEASGTVEVTDATALEGLAGQSEAWEEQP